MTALEQLLINASSSSSSSSSSAVTTVSSSSVSLNSSRKNPNEATTTTATTNKTLALQNNNSKHLSRLVEVNTYTKGLSANTPNTNGSSNSITISNSSPKTSVELKENFSRLLKSTTTTHTTTTTTTTPPESPQNQLVDYLACNQMIIEKNESSLPSLERAQTNETNGTQKKSTNDLVILVETSGICVKKANVDGGEEIGIDINSNLIEGVDSDGDLGGDETLTKTVRVEVKSNDLESATLNQQNNDEKFSIGMSFVLPLNSKIK